MEMTIEDFSSMPLEERNMVVQLLTDEFLHETEFYNCDAAFDGAADDVDGAEGS